jgi:hypothetical protein
MGYGAMVVQRDELQNRNAMDRIVAALHFINDGREMRSASLCLG